MENIYTDGSYARLNPTWHSEDSLWKAQQIATLLSAHKLTIATVAEIGCGAGGVLKALQGELPSSVQLFGFDISQDAIARTEGRKGLQYFCDDLLKKKDHFDLLLAIDVVEHVPDYLEFLSKCRQRARFKLYHIPLDIHVSSVLRASFIEGRRTMGHIHYFTAESALASLIDTGHRIVDSTFTDGAIGLARFHPSWKRRVANIPRRLIGSVSRSWAARLLGGYSLMVLAE